MWQNCWWDCKSNQIIRYKQKLTFCSNTIIEDPFDDITEIDLTDENQEASGESSKRPVNISITKSTNVPESEEFIIALLEISTLAAIKFPNLYTLFSTSIKQSNNLVSILTLVLF